MGAWLISFEGLDGAGKTTQIEQLKAYLGLRGMQAVVLREPGSTRLGEEVRSLLKSGMARSQQSELLLFMAARAELVHEKLRPALAAGKTVLLDRFSDSTIAYQGALGMVPEDELAQLCRIAASGIEPDITFWIDLPASDALVRRQSSQNATESPAMQPDGASDRQGLDAIEKRSLEYFERVRQLYAELARREPGRIKRIDGSGGPQEVAERINSVMEEAWPI